MPKTLHRTPSKARGYIEPKLDLGGAVPLHMVRIPGGTFVMGSPEDEPERRDAEGPLHQVSISTFFMGRYPVTQSQWRSVAAMPQVNRVLELDPSKFKGDNLPVERVSWYESVEFCDRLTEHTGRSYRLPSEAEWEYACRAGTTTSFFFGDMISTEVANYSGRFTYGDSPKGEYRNTTTPVGQLDNANLFGLSDMHGNVSEWCQDHWHRNYAGAPIDGSAWLTEAENVKRVRRGGSWYSYPWFCRSAYRDDFTPGSRSDCVGFRVSCVAPRALA